MIEIGKKRPDTDAPILKRVEALESLCFKICEVTETNLLTLETTDKKMAEKIAEINSAVNTLSGQIESLAGSQEV